MANKVRFGLSNAHYAVYDDETGEYKTPVAIKGSVSLSIDPEGDTSSFYADNIVYYQTVSNTGYSGSLEIAAAEDQMLTDLLGYIDDSGLILEDTGATIPTFALMFEVNGNVAEQRTVLYNCTMSRPTSEASTTEDTIEPQTQTFDFTAVGRDMTVLGNSCNVVKATIENTTDNATKYESFMDAVLLPTTEASA